MRVASELAAPPGLVLEFGGTEIELADVAVAHLGEVQQQPDGAGERADHGADQHRAQSAGIADPLGQQVALDQVEGRDLPPHHVHQRPAGTRFDETDGFVMPSLGVERQHLPIDFGELLPGLRNLLQVIALRNIVLGPRPQQVERGRDLGHRQSVGREEGVLPRQQIAADAGLGIERRFQEVGGELPDFDGVLHPALGLVGAKRERHRRQARKAHQRDRPDQKAEPDR